MKIPRETLEAIGAYIEAAMEYEAARLATAADGYAPNPRKEFTAKGEAWQYLVEVNNKYREAE